MTPQEYLRILKRDTGKTLKEISAESRIPYSTLLGYSNGEKKGFSDKTIKLMAQYEGIPEEFVHYKLLLDLDNMEYCSEEALMYLANIQCNFPYTVHPYKIYGDGDIVFDGSYYHTRSGKDYTLVESWQKLKERYWYRFHSEEKKSYSSDKLLSLFKSPKACYNAVFNYGVSKILGIYDEKRVIKCYKIIFSESELDERNLLSDIYFKTDFKIDLEFGGTIEKNYLYYNFNIWDADTDIFNVLYWYCVDSVQNNYSDFSDYDLYNIKKHQYLASKKIIDYLDAESSGNDIQYFILIIYLTVYRLRSSQTSMAYSMIRSNILSHINKVVSNLENGIDDKNPLDLNLAAIKKVFSDYQNYFTLELYESVIDDMKPLIEVYEKHQKK